MFKNAATKLAHNTTIPALSGNKDLRPLQDLITAEKVVLVSLQKLSVDFAKAAEALRIWGTGEGDDLGDILGASTTILAHFSGALSGYAAREHAIRDHLKAIRTREEALDELKRRRKAALARADSAEKKLNKMGPEHKNLAAQTDLLAQMQAQIRGMDGEIMNEEAALGDFKRTSARALMGLKFGGLMECCEKGCVVAECGRGVVSEISEETTQPGLSRAMYLGHQRTEQRVQEAERAVAEIVFAPLPAGSNANGGPGAPPRLNTDFDANSGMGMGGLSVNNTGMGSISTNNTGMGSISGNSIGMGGTTPYEGSGSNFLPPLPPPDVGAGLMDGGTPQGGGYASSIYSASQGQSGYGASAPGGYGASPGGSYGASTPGGSYGGSAPGGSYGASAPGGSYGASAPGGSYGTSAPGGSYGASAPGASYGASAPGSTYASPPDPEARDDADVGLSSTGVGVGGEGPGGGRFATFPVRGRGYSLRDEQVPSVGSPGRKETSGSDFMAAVLDAGEFGGRSSGGAGVGVAAAASQGSQFSQAGSQFSQPGSQFLSKQQERERERERQQQQEEEPAPEYRDYEPTTHSQVYDYAGGGPVPPGPPPGAAAPVLGGVWVGDNGGTGTGTGPRSPTGLTVEEGGGDRQSTTSENIGLAYMSMDDGPPGETERDRAARLSKHVRFGEESVFAEPAEPPYMKREDSFGTTNSTSPSSRSRRVPPPSVNPEDDERALNAAAAREVSRELDALTFSPPPPPAPQVQVQSEPSWEFAQTSPKTSPKTSPSRENREYGSPPTGRDYAPSPPSQYAAPPAPNRDYAASPPNREYTPELPQSYASQQSAQYVPAPPPPNREPSPLIPPAAPFTRKATLDNVSLPPGAGHQSTPSWDARDPRDAPVQPAPFVPGHHTTPSWAITPAPPSDGPHSPTSPSPRLEPYRAPIASRSTSSLNSQVPPGVRTISAAAFRRPQKTASGDVADTSPLAFKKRLPASPYPQQRAGSALRDQPQPPAAPRQQQEPSEEDSFDYISAYERDSQAFLDDGSPMEANFDYGRLGKVEVVGGAPTSPGYSEGRFATDLDPDGVR